MPLRLCVVVTGLGIGGAEHALLRLLSRFDRDRYDISLIVLGRDDALAAEFQAAGVRPVILGLSAGRWPIGQVRRFLQLVRRARPEIIQGWMYHGNFAASYAAAHLKSPVRVCWSIRDTPDAAHAHSAFTRAVIHLSRWYAPRVDRIFNVSARSAAYCAARFGWAQERMDVLPNGIDTSKFSPDSEARLAQRARWNATGPVIGMIARWSPVKNHALFLESMALLRRQRPEATFVLAGTGVDATNAELLQAARRLGLEDRLRLLGQSSNLASVYPALDVAVLTSKSEGFPNVIAEAMSCGVPAVSTDVGDARDIIGDAGRVVSADAAAIALACADVAECAPQLGARARARIVRHYDIRLAVDRLQSKYVELRRSPRTLVAVHAS